MATTLSANSNSTPSTSSTERPALRRKRSSFSDVFKITVLGANGVGKTAMVVRFLTKRFIGEYDQIADNKYRHSEVLDHDQILIEIVDTHCNPTQGEQFTKEENIKWGDGFLLVYSITNRASFDFLEVMKPKLYDLKRANQLPIMVVGNKKDMDHERQVTEEEAKSYAARNNFLFYELSTSEEPLQVREAFHLLCKEIATTKRRSRTILDRVFGGIGSHKK